MPRKLQCILVDDDPTIHDVFEEYLKDCEYATIIDHYQDPREFIKSNKRPDMVFIDIVMPHIDGFTLAQSIKPTPVILFTGNIKHFKDIMNMIEPIDVFAKPIIKERLLKSVKNAYFLLKLNDFRNGYELFHTNEGMINVLLSDILFVKTIKNSHRNLEMYLKRGKKLIIKGYSLEYIHQIANFLLQSNRSELVSPEAIDLIEHNSFIKLRDVNDNGKLLHSELCYSFRNDFLASIHSI